VKKSLLAGVPHPPRSPNPYLAYLIDGTGRDAGAWKE
jgi:hypothetical protein